MSTMNTVSDFYSREVEARKNPEERRQSDEADAIENELQKKENEKKKNIQVLLVKSEIEALNELKRDQSLIDALKILVKNFTFILKDTKGGKTGIIFAGPYGTKDFDKHYDKFKDSSRNYTSDYITYAPILRNTKDLYTRQNERPKGIFSKSASVEIHTNTTDELRRRIDEMEANKDIYEFVSQKFRGLWQEKFKKMLNESPYDDEKTNYDKIFDEFFIQKSINNTQLFNLVIMYLFPKELKYAELPAIYGISGDSGQENAYNGILDPDYKQALDEYSGEEAAKRFKTNPDSVPVGGRRTKRRKLKMGHSVKKMRPKRLKQKQNTKMNKRRRTYKRR